MLQFIYIRWVKKNKVWVYRVDNIKGMTKYWTAWFKQDRRIDKNLARD